MEKKYFYIKTYGCQMNVYDSDRISASMLDQGFLATQQADQADVILLNTCHIREKAAEKIYSELGRFKPLKKQKPEMKIGVVGCVAQAEGKEIIARQPLVDVVVGPQSYTELPDLLQKSNEKPQVLTEFPRDDKFSRLPSHIAQIKSPSAFLTIQEGCDKFCSFCVVPYTRGAENSRPIDQVINEAKAMVENGVREITLLGQNVNAYQGDSAIGKQSLADLIYKLASIDDLKRIRYTTSHPNDMSDDLMMAHRDIDKLMPYLHLPIQSGSNAILKAMNRKHTRETYLKIIDTLRNLRPDMAISGDFIVGFPGESDKDFQDTLDLVKQIGYAQAYSFKYSTRPGTPAVKKEQISEEVKSERLQELQNLLNAQQQSFQSDLVGKDLTVLIEKQGREKAQMTGRSDYLIPVHITGNQDDVGKIFSVNITKNYKNSLQGEIIH